MPGPEVDALQTLANKTDSPGSQGLRFQLKEAGAGPPVNYKSSRTETMVMSGTQLCLTLGTPWTVACQAPLSMASPRQEYWSELAFPSPGDLPVSGIKAASPAFSSVCHSVVSDSLRPHGLQHARLPCPSPTPRLAQTHVHRVGDAIQPSLPLSSPSSPAFNLSQHQGPFQ